MAAGHESRGDVCPLYDGITPPDGEPPPEDIADAALALTPGDTHSDVACGSRTLFFVPAGVLGLRVWALADSGAGRNIISEAQFRRLPKCPAARGLDLRPLADNQQVRVGNGSFLDLLGTVILPVSIANATVYHAFSVSKDITIPIVLGNEILEEHLAQLCYRPLGGRVLTFARKTCAICEANKGLFGERRGGLDVTGGENPRCGRPVH
jgi:hypothetical protein